MNLPLISIILPVYNRERYVADAIESILKQTYENFELIIIDDGSTDDSIEFIEKYDDSRIKLFQLPFNQGLSTARNRGIENSKGKYIAFMDSDDISHPQRLVKQIEILETNEEIWVCGSWLKLMNSGVIIKHRKDHKELLCQMLINCPLSIGAVSMRAEIFEKEKFNEKLRFGEDYEFWSRVIWKTRLYNLQESLLFYRIHENQNSIENIHSQKLLDIQIRLKMFKKLAYDQKRFPDNLIKKHFLFDEYISVKEFAQFLRWLEHIDEQNRIEQIYPSLELHGILCQIRKKLIHQIYFIESKIGIDKYWRFRALGILKWADTIDVLRKKIKSSMRKR
ncbi:glycosyltransferase [Zunongwangia sp. F363]|uniref:Glycosyltransferase n=1 Tax=Autumnicola tepida TaxID=3075595 RepID=A0ABU3C9V9_9FLAO|nr:glycosyltransferase [Zunongwangia sp. F363]MDT0643048.1 glycosyltransferase [Zunongwangia sp. F363]